jgi:formyl-CoA transferase
LADDPRFRGVASRLEHGDEINQIVSEWVAAHAVDEVLSILGPDGAGVPCSPVYTVDQLIDHPQLAARGMIERLPHPKLGTLLTPGVVIKMSDTPGGVRTLAPELGQHTDEVLTSLLGLSPDDVAELRAAQVI